MFHQPIQVHGAERLVAPADKDEQSSIAEEPARGPQPNYFARVRQEAGDPYMSAGAKLWWVP